MDIEAKIDYVLDFYKELTSRSRLKNTTPALRNGIKARLREKYSVEECIMVIRWKHSQWWEDDLMKNYCNPVTLFRPSHFQIYLCEAEENLEVVIREKWEKHMDCMFESMQKGTFVKFEDYKAEYLSGKVANG